MKSLFQISGIACAIVILSAGTIELHAQCAVWDPDSYGSYCVLHTDPVATTRVAIGLSDAKNLLDVNGGAVFGSSYANTFTAPSNGLLVEGSLGLGVSSPVNKLDVEGAAVIGAGFAGISTAPGNGLLVEGSVGIGSSSTKCKLEVTGGCVLFDGSTGANPNLGAGTRLLWIPDKAALRAGSASGTEWDSTNVGNNSTAFGSAVTASGTGSFASGVTLTASNLGSAAFGIVNTSSGFGSLVSGYLSSASGNYSTALGSFNTASGSSSVALNNGTDAIGTNSLAAGNNSIASGANTIAIGQNVTASAANAFVFGRGCNSINPLDNNIANSLMVGFNTVNPTFFVGAATDPCPETAEGIDTVEASHCGRVGICTPDPTHTLHVAGDARIDHSLRIGRLDQCTGTNSDYSLSVNGKIVARSLVVTTSGWCDFVFEDDYDLMPLNELEETIKAQKHLPGIPSEADVMRDGVSVGEMQARLLQKIEELTLYVIDQNKTIETLQTRLAELEERR